MLKSRCLALVTFLSIVATIAAQGYVVDRFDATIDLHKDSSMDVQERIAVTFSEARHGIYRFIPIDLPTKNGATRRLYVSAISADDERGTPITAAIESAGVNVRIRLGDKDVELSPGTQKTYVIRYHAENMINWFGESNGWGGSAELYWNATGNEWDTPIGAAHVIVNFPDAKNGAQLRARVITGPYGSTEGQTLEGLASNRKDSTSQTVVSLSTSKLEISRLAALNPGEGLTFVLGVPADLLDKPSLGREAMMTLIPNLGFGLPLLALLFGFVGWSLFGRDPKQGPLAVQFDPPDDISGPEAGAFIDERVDQRDLAAGIISLAVKGYLTVEPIETGMIFKHRSANLHPTGKTSGPELTVFEAQLLAMLTLCGDPIGENDLRVYVAPNISSLKSSLYDSLIDRGYYLSSPATARGIFSVAGVLFLVACGLLVTLLSPLHSPFPAIVGGIIGVPLILVFANQAPRRTTAGAKAWGKLRGFEEFMRRARAPELDWVSEKHPDQAMFEKYLPHAVAFGIADVWAQSFVGIVEEMPSWYMSPYGSVYNPLFFAGDITSISSTMASAASTPPRSDGASGGSSGFGGGGFSGGGSGGGGGGSW